MRHVMIKSAEVWERPSPHVVSLKQALHVVHVVHTDCMDICKFSITLYEAVVAVVVH